MQNWWDQDDDDANADEDLQALQARLATVEYVSSKLLQLRRTYIMECVLGLTVGSAGKSEVAAADTAGTAAESAPCRTTRSSARAALEQQQFLLSEPSSRDDDPVPMLKHALKARKLAGVVLSPGVCCQLSTLR